MQRAYPRPPLLDFSGLPLSLQGNRRPFSLIDANPILAETVRGNWVENRHRGSFVVCDAQGNVIVSAGDIERSIFPRSAV